MSDGMEHHVHAMRACGHVVPLPECDKLCLTASRATIRVAKNHQRLPVAPTRRLSKAHEREPAKPLTLNPKLKP